jgi:hypothetical protein
MARKEPERIGKCMVVTEDVESSLQREFPEKIQLKNHHEVAERWFRTNKIFPFSDHLC